MQDTVSPSGWCSWYYFSGSDYTGTVTPEAIRQNSLAAASLRPELPLDLIQIDDGFESNVGDWFTFKPDFPQGVSPLAGAIRQSGLTPGLWLAPFIVHPKSDLYRMQSEWLLRNRRGRPVNAGYCWNSFTTALDLTHPEALDYTKQVVQRAVQDWGFEYLKLDFLYAASLPGKFHDQHKTRAQVLRSALETVRLAAGPQATLLGCGCPLGPAIGPVDSMRIGTDTARTWVPNYQGTKTYFQQDVSMPSARNSLHNALTRAALHKRWWINDPDCLLVRPDSQLTLEEIHTAASVIALTGGSLFLSDDLPQLPAERLRIAQVLLPLMDQRPYLLDWSESSTPSLLQLDLSNASGSWSLLGIFNWQDKPLEKVLRLNQTYLDPEKKYLAREFWSGRVYQITDGQLILDQLPAHACALLSVRLLNPRYPQYVGSDLHVSQGLEITEWKIADSELTFRIDRPGKSHGMVDIYLPTPPQQAMCGSEQINTRLVTQDVYRLELDVDNSAFITIH
jgi:alpha-galactosidase